MHFPCGGDAPEAGAAARVSSAEGQPPPPQGGQVARQGAPESAPRRQDFHHKEALKLVQAYDTIYHESLQVANLLKNHHLAKAITDAGWSAFLSILSFKAAEAGKQAVAVPPAFTSQACSGCGALVVKGLSVRWHACPNCGTSLHRDHNAALNILARGRESSRLGQSLQALT